jgi:hypothetical protein
VFFPKVKRLGRDFDHAPPTIAEVKRLRMSGAMPLLPLYAFIRRTGKTSLYRQYTT